MTQRILTQSDRDKLIKRRRDYYKTKNGLVSRIYGNQKVSSKRRNHPLPDYSLKELRAWVFSQDCFEQLYQAWVDSGFKKRQVPSCDRIDDYQPYTLGNLQLVTWQENNDRYDEDTRNGINNKRSKAVLQMTKEGEPIMEYHSASHASRVTRIHLGHLAACCRGQLKSAGGFKWSFLGEK